MQVHLNVNRTRITVLGFNLALLFFLIGVLIEVGRQHDVRAVWAFLPSFAHIATGFSLTLAAIMMILIAQSIDSPGSIALARFSIGELLMYIALAQTLSAGLQLFVGAFELTFRVLPAELAVSPAVATEILRVGEHLTDWIHALAAIVWLGVTYFAPGVFLFRIPLPRQPKLLLATSYLVLLSTVFWITSSAYFAHSLARGESGSHARMFVRQLWQPLLWRDASLLQTKQLDEI